MKQMLKQFPIPKVLQTQKKPQKTLNLHHTFWALVTLSSSRVLKIEF